MNNFWLPSVIYGLCGAVSMSFCHLIGVERNASVIVKASMNSFKALPASDPRVALNESSRTLNGWEVKQINVAEDIVRNRQPGWDWLPFMGYRFDLRETMQKAHISLLPHKQSGLPATLVVDKEHGCLLIDYERATRESADQARALLDTFRERAASRYNYLGTYVVNVGNKRDVSVDYTAGGKAADYCPKAAAPTAP